MLTSSTSIVHQKATAPISPINGYGPAAGLHHSVLESNLSSQPQVQAHSVTTTGDNINTVLSQESISQNTLPVALGQTTPNLEPNGTRTKRSLPSRPQGNEQPQRRQSTLQFFHPKDCNPNYEEQFYGTMAPGNIENSNTVSPTEVLNEQQQIDDKKLVVRLDLRKLGLNGAETRSSTKKTNTQRNSIHKKSLDGSLVKTPAGGQTTLSAQSWAHAKPVQNGSHIGSSIAEPHIEDRKEQDEQLWTTLPDHKSATIPVEAKEESLPQHIVTNATLPDTDMPIATPKTTTAAVSAPRKSTPDSELRTDIQSEDDPDHIETGSRSMKRSNSSSSWTDQIIKKRTRSSNQGVAKKKKVQEERRIHQESQHQERPTLKKKGSLKQMAKIPSTSSVPVSAVSAAAVDQSKDINNTGDANKIDHNNDYCEACSGLGEFICCDSCPKAFHFSCCQPPVDPLALPDEWNCKECHARKFPPKPNPKGLFKQLLDNINRTNPKAFALPSDIQLFFKGVVANSDGEYEDVVDYKPRPKRATTTSSNATPIKADFETLQLQDSQDCLTPPLASPPPSTSKWMCPNHADHVTPRRRKRKDAAPVELKDHRAANDGQIEVIPDPETTPISIWSQDTSGIVFRVHERDIKQSFIEKCQRIREQQQHQQWHDQNNRKQKAGSMTQVSAGSASAAVLPFNLLVAAAMVRLFTSLYDLLYYEAVLTKV
ncbi:hypothetical protein FBU30_010244 [Linnemannia zychae]|nr:hypothetical protein FBU30_010244 [Linnemannia zychae]